MWGTHLHIAGRGKVTKHAGMAVGLCGEPTFISQIKARGGGHYKIWLMEHKIGCDGRCKLPS